MIETAAVSPPNSLVLIRGAGEADVPISGEPVAHTDTCVSIGTLMEYDGETSIRLMAADEGSEHPHPPLEVFDGTLIVRGTELVVGSVTGDEYLSLPCPEGEVPVRVYTNHSTEPDEIHVVVG